MLNVAICDDDTLMLARVGELVGEFFRKNCMEIKTQLYQSSENLTYDLQDGLNYDLFLLDIEMPGANGMELAKSIHDHMPAATVIFITSHLEYAIEAYEFSVFRYIPKSAIEEKLPAALRDFYKLYGLERNEFYMVQTKKRVEQLNYREILYILKNGKYAVFYLSGSRTVSVRKTLAQVFKEINKDYFYFVDRGCIVNLAKVIGVNDNGVLLPDDRQLVISRSSIPELKKVLLKFWGRQI